MSYTPPAGDEINFTWVGEAEYTPPAGDEINFSWVDGGGNGGGSSPEPIGETVAFTAIAFTAITFTALGEGDG